MTIAESIPLEDPNNKKKDYKYLYFKAKIFTEHKADGINDTVKSLLAEHSIVFTDISSSYINIADFVEQHVSKK